MIYLPPPKPPVIAKRETEDGSKTAMAASAAPAVPGLSRQARRKAMRDEAKAQRRLGQPPAPKPGTARPNPKLAQEAMAAVLAGEAPAVPPAEPIESIAAPEPLELAEEPAEKLADLGAPEPAGTPLIAPVGASVPTHGATLPRGRALVSARPGGLTLFVQKLRSFFVVQKRRQVPADRMAVAQQLHTLRAEMAALQRSLDRIIDGVAT